MFTLGLVPVAAVEAAVGSVASDPGALELSLLDHSVSV